jgi:hypothetical protein
MYLWIEFDAVATVLNRPIEIDLLLSQSNIAIARAQTDVIRERVVESGPDIPREIDRLFDSREDVCGSVDVEKTRTDKTRSNPLATRHVPLPRAG